MQKNHTIIGNDIIYYTTDYDTLQEWIASAENLDLTYSANKSYILRSKAISLYPQISSVYCFNVNLEDDEVAVYQLTIKR